MSSLVWSACLDYLWLDSFFTPVLLHCFIFLSLTVVSCLTLYTFHPHTHFFRKNLPPVCMCASLCDCWCVYVLHVDFFHHHCGFILPVFITTVGSCTSSCHCASKNPLRWIRKQRSVHSGLVLRSLQWGGNGISMHTITPADFQSRALDKLWPHMWSLPGFFIRWQCVCHCT